MSWIPSVPGATAFEQQLGHRPELLEHYRRFYRTFWDDGLAPGDLLEICRLRIAGIHDCEAEWLLRDASVPLTSEQLQALRKGDFAGFEPRQRAALDIAEKLPFAHHQITDAEVDALKQQVGSPAAVALLTAMAFFDVNCRLKLVLDVPALPATLATPPLSAGGIA